MPKKVLIIEDDEALLNVLTYKITDVGFTVIKALSGDEGLNLALEEHPDLILLDLLLPEISGLNILKTLRKDAWGKQAPVFVLTNLSAYNTIYRSLELMAEAYFIKSDNTLENIADEVKNRLS